MELFSIYIVFFMDTYTSPFGWGRQKDSELVVDKPFLFIMVVDRDIVAFGRIKDPYWSIKHSFF